MDDYSRRRGRKPRHEGDRLEKISNIRYKCPYTACSLEYQSSLGYKRHLMYYKHALFAPSRKKIMCAYVGCSETENLREHIYLEHPEDAAELLEAHEVMTRTADEMEEIRTVTDHDIVHDEGLLDISKVAVDGGLIKTVIMHTFPKGIIYIIDFDEFREAHQVFHCRIPGCGRQFKSLMAYKYHCGKFTHTFRSIVDDFASTGQQVDYKAVRDEFKQRFNLENRFLLEGVSHHLMRMPDQYYNFIFTFDDSNVGHEKRKIKRKTPDGLLEYSLGRETGSERMEEPSEEEDPKKSKESEEEKSAFRINTVRLNGRRLPGTREYTHGRVSTLNLAAELTCAAVLPGGLVVMGANCEESGRGTNAAGRSPEKETAKSSAGFAAHRTEQDASSEDGGIKPYNIFSFFGGNALFFLIRDMQVVGEAFVAGPGFPRKIVGTGERTVLCLFNDGSIRELIFHKTLLKEPVHKDGHHESQTENQGLEKMKVLGQGMHFVGFVVLNGDVIAGTHNTLFNLTQNRKWVFSAPIISVEKTSTSVLVVDSNGKTHVVSPAMDAPMLLSSKVGTNSAVGLGLSHNLIFLSNSMYGLGRIYSADTGGTLLVTPHASSHAILIQPGYIISSGLDGSLCVSSYESDPKSYMRILSAEMKEEELCLTTSDREIKLSESEINPPANQDYRVCVQAILSLDRALIAVFACGVVVSVSEFFREPPQLP